jgi:hypothetical protein
MDFQLQCQIIVVCHRFAYFVAAVHVHESTVHIVLGDVAIVTELLAASVYYIEE